MWDRRRRKRQTHEHMSLPIIAAAGRKDFKAGVRRRDFSGGFLRGILQRGRISEGDSSFWVTHGSFKVEGFLQIE